MSSFYTFYLSSLGWKVTQVALQRTTGEAGLLFLEFLL